jgi:hypothetical protein
MGVMVQIDASSIISPDARITVSPQLQQEEQEIVKRLIKRGREGQKEPLELNEDWARLYASYKDPPNEAPFATEDKTTNPFKDLE